MPRKRPPILHGKTIKLHTSCGSVYLTLNRDENNKLIEIGIRMGKAGTCRNAGFFILGVVLSSWLQDGAHLAQIKAMMKAHFLGTTCDNPMHKEGKKFVTCYDVLGDAIIKEIEAIEKETK